MATTNEITPADPVPLQDEGLTPPRPAADVPEYRRPEALARYDSETVELVNVKVCEIDEADREYHQVNEEVKRLKKVWEARLDDLQKLIRDRREQRGKPVQKTLLDIIPEVAEVAVVEVTPVEADPLDSLWREFPLDRLSEWGVRATDVQRLADGALKGSVELRPCLTVGQITDYTSNAGGSPDHKRHLADFRGLGPAGCTRIDAGLDGFWRWWNAGGLEAFAAERGWAMRLNPDLERKLLSLGATVTPVNPAALGPTPAAGSRPTSSRSPPRPTPPGNTGSGDRPPKYRNRKVVLTPDGRLVPHDPGCPAAGVVFDSTKEARRWLVLVALQKAGAIQALERQKWLRVVVNGVKVCSYVADYYYVEKGRRVVEDCKSRVTARLPVYVLKKKLLAAALGVEIREYI